MHHVLSQEFPESLPSSFFTNSPVNSSRVGMRFLQRSRSEVHRDFYGSAIMRNLIFRCWHLLLRRRIMPFALLMKAAGNLQSLPEFSLPVSCFRRLFKDFIFCHFF